MKVLSLEFSSSQRSVAVFDPAHMVEPIVVVATPAPPRQGTGVFALVAEALRQVGWQQQEVTHLAVGLGPGSYTGIRAAISAAQGWAAAAPLIVLGVPAVDMLAEQLRREGTRGEVLLAFDAQRGELYAERFRIDPNGIESLSHLRLTTLAEAKSALDEGIPVHGPDLAVLMAEARPLFPCAGTAARLAVSPSYREVRPEALAPIYLREVSFVKLPLFQARQEN